MTIPLGFLLPLIWSDFRSIKKVALVGFCLSLTIEVTQLFTYWRLSCTDDLIANTLGAVLGCLIFKVFVKIFRKIEAKPFSVIIKHEAVYYLVLSFVGVFVLYHNRIV